MLLFDLPYENKYTMSSTDWSDTKKYTTVVDT